MKKLKTIEDFPKFLVTAVRRGATSDDGYTQFEIDGIFDRAIKNISPNWFWLLFGARGSLCASLKSLARETNEATLTCDLEHEPAILGMRLAYLSPYWRAFNVWMVGDPSWGWQKKQFHSLDAIAEEFEAENASIVDGSEVKTWTKLSPAQNERGVSRYYPASDLGAESRVVPSVWDHEHCELCKSHIDAGVFGFCDPGDRWMCVKCYESYVVPHDLSCFIEDDEVIS